MKATSLRKIIVISLLGSFILAVAGCSAPAEPTATVVPTAIPASPLPTQPAATDTPLPTETAVPASATPAPSEIPTLAATATASGPQTSAIADALTMEGQTALIQGTVVDLNSFSAGFKFTLQDESEQIELVLFQDTYAAIAGNEDLRLGAQIMVNGEIGSYNDQMQIVPKNSSDVEILHAGDGAQTITAIGDLTLEDVGKLYTIEGQVRGFDYFSKGARMQLKDASGSIDVVLWQNVLDFVPDAKGLIQGPQVQLTGRVGEYKGKLQIVPQIGFDVLQLPK